MKVSDFLNIDKVKGYAREFIERNRKLYDAMYDVTDVPRGYLYYKKLLLEKAIGIYEYSGLPDSIPQHEIERLLLLRGNCIFVDSKKYSRDGADYGLVALPVNFSGIGIYDDLQPNVLFATPLVAGDGAREDFAIGYNNSTHLPIRETINRYSRIMADVESTFSSYLYLLRKPFYAAAPDENTAESYNAAMIANRLGQQLTVFDQSTIKAITMLPAAEQLNATQLTEIYSARENILRTFLSELGVQYNNDKRERMSVDEVHANTQALVVNASDMLKAREKMCDDVNARYGTNISVRINPAYDILAQIGGMTNNGNTVNADDRRRDEDRKNNDARSDADSDSE